MALYVLNCRYDCSELGQPGSVPSVRYTHYWSEAHHNSRCFIHCWQLWNVL